MTDVISVIKQEVIKIDTGNIDIENRARKAYKNKSFGLLLRELISNGLHSCILNGTGKLEITIQAYDNYHIIKIKDNGEGFNDKNLNYFRIMDKENPEKKEKRLGSFGQGRLAIVHFTDGAEYYSVFKYNNGELRANTFTYPDRKHRELFPCESGGTETRGETGAEVIVQISEKKKHERAGKFFKDHDNSEKFKNWMYLNFFPLLANNKFDISVRYNDKADKLEPEDVYSDEFFVTTKDNEDEKREYKFVLYLIESEKIKGAKKFNCCAKGLVCKLSSEKQLQYNLEGDKCCYFLTSEYFDDNIDDVGDKIEIEDEGVIDSIQKEIDRILNERHKEQIAANRKKTRKNVEDFRKKYPSFRPFLRGDVIDSFINEVPEKDLLSQAAGSKTEAERIFWSNEKETGEENALIQSSLSCYIKHREKVLNRCKNDFLDKLDSDGNIKPGNEREIHNILFRKSRESYQNNEEDYYSHNLWLIDDKYSLFTSAMSTVGGRKESDIYLYCDTPEELAHMVIIELKSSVKAHNQGGMIKQVREYAKMAYSNDNAYIKGCVNNSKKCVYTAYIIASQKDIQAEWKRYEDDNGRELPMISFLRSSYYVPESHVGTGNEKCPLRIELISYNDFYTLAHSRNKHLIKLMYKEEGE